MFCIRIIKYSNILNQNKLTRIYWNKLIENSNFSKNNRII